MIQIEATRIIVPGAPVPNPHAQIVLPGAKPPRTRARIILVPQPCPPPVAARCSAAVARLIADAIVAQAIMHHRS